MSGGIVLTSKAFDSRAVAASTGAATPGALAAETFPRHSHMTTGTPVAQNVYLHRLYLQAGAYTTVTILKTTQGATLTNTYFGLYDAAMTTKIAESADLSTPFAAIAANAAGTLTFNSTVTAPDWYYLALLIGSAATMPVLLRQAAQTEAQLALAPAVAARHNATVTALPAAITVSGVNNVWFWLRYS